MNLSPMSCSPAPISPIPSAACCPPIGPRLPLPTTACLQNRSFYPPAFQCPFKSEESDKNERQSPRDLSARNPFYNDPYVMLCRASQPTCGPTGSPMCPPCSPFSTCPPSCCSPIVPPPPLCPPPIPSPCRSPCDGISPPCPPPLCRPLPGLRSIVPPLCKSSCCPPMCPPCCPPLCPPVFPKFCPPPCPPICPPLCRPCFGPPLCMPAYTSPTAPVKFVCDSPMTSDGSKPSNGAQTYRPYDHPCLRVCQSTEQLQTPSSKNGGERSCRACDPCDLFIKYLKIDSCPCDPSPCDPRPCDPCPCDPCPCDPCQRDPSIKIIINEKGKRLGKKHDKIRCSKGDPTDKMQNVKGDTDASSYDPCDLLRRLQAPDGHACDYFARYLVKNILESTPKACLCERCVERYYQLVKSYLQSGRCCACPPNNDEKSRNRNSIHASGVSNECKAPFYFLGNRGCADVGIVGGNERETARVGFGRGGGADGVNEANRCCGNDNGGCCDCCRDDHTRRHSRVIKHNGNCSGREGSHSRDGTCSADVSIINDKGELIGLKRTEGYLNEGLVSSKHRRGSHFSECKDDVCKICCAEDGTLHCVTPEGRNLAVQDFGTNCANSCRCSCSCEEGKNLCCGGCGRTGHSVSFELGSSNNRTCSDGRRFNARLSSGQAVLAENSKAPDGVFFNVDCNGAQNSSKAKGYRRQRANSDNATCHKICPCDGSEGCVSTKSDLGSERPGHCRGIKWCLDGNGARGAYINCTGSRPESGAGYRGSISREKRSTGAERCGNFDFNGYLGECLREVPPVVLQRLISEIKSLCLADQYFCSGEGGLCHSREDAENQSAKNHTEPLGGCFAPKETYFGGSHRQSKETKVPFHNCRRHQSTVETVCHQDEGYMGTNTRTAEELCEVTSVTSIDITPGQADQKRTSDFPTCVGMSRQQSSGRKIRCPPGETCCHSSETQTRRVLTEDCHRHSETQTISTREEWSCCQNSETRGSLFENTCCCDSDAQTGETHHHRQPVAITRFENEAVKHFGTQDACTQEFRRHRAKQLCNETKNAAVQKSSRHYKPEEVKTIRHPHSETSSCIQEKKICHPGVETAPCTIEEETHTYQHSRRIYPCAPGQRCPEIRKMTTKEPTQTYSHELEEKTPLPETTHVQPKSPCHSLANTSSDYEKRPHCYPPRSETEKENEIPREYFETNIGPPLEEISSESPGTTQHAIEAKTFVSWPHELETHITQDKKTVPQSQDKVEHYNIPRHSQRDLSTIPQEPPKSRGSHIRREPRKPIEVSVHDQSVPKISSSQRWPLAPEGTRKFSCYDQDHACVPASLSFQNVLPTEKAQSLPGQIRESKSYQHDRVEAPPASVTHSPTDKFSEFFHHKKESTGDSFKHSEPRSPDTEEPRPISIAQDSYPMHEESRGIVHGERLPPESSKQHIPSKPLPAEGSFVDSILQEPSKDSTKLYYQEKSSPGSSYQQVFPKAPSAQETRSIPDDASGHVYHEAKSSSVTMTHLDSSVTQISSAQRPDSDSGRKSLQNVPDSTASKTGVPWIRDHSSKFSHGGKVSSAVGDQSRVSSILHEPEFQAETHLVHEDEPRPCTDCCDVSRYPTSGDSDQQTATMVLFDQLPHCRSATYIPPFTSDTSFIAFGSETELVRQESSQPLYSENILSSTRGSGYQQNMSTISPDQELRYDSKASRQPVQLETPIRLSSSPLVPETSFVQSRETAILYQGQQSNAANEEIAQLSYYDSGPAARRCAIWPSVEGKSNLGSRCDSAIKGSHSKQNITFPTSETETVLAHEEREPSRLLYKISPTVPSSREYRAAVSSADQVMQKDSSTIKAPVYPHALLNDHLKTESQLLPDESRIQSQGLVHVSNRQSYEPNTRDLERFGHLQRSAPKEHKTTPPLVSTSNLQPARENYSEQHSHYAKESEIRRPQHLGTKASGTEEYVRLMEKNILHTEVRPEERKHHLRGKIFYCVEGEDTLYQMAAAPHRRLAIIELSESDRSSEGEIIIIKENNPISLKETSPVKTDGQKRTSTEVNDAPVYGISADCCSEDPKNWFGITYLSKTSLLRNQPTTKENGHLKISTFEADQKQPMYSSETDVFSIQRGLFSDNELNRSPTESGYETELPPHQGLSTRSQSNKTFLSSVKTLTSALSRTKEKSPHVFLPGVMISNPSKNSAKGHPRNTSGISQEESTGDYPLPKPCSAHHNLGCIEKEKQATNEGTADGFTHSTEEKKIPEILDSSAAGEAPKFHTWFSENMFMNSGKTIKSTNNFQGEENGLSIGKPTDLFTSTQETREEEKALSAKSEVKPVEKSEIEGKDPIINCTEEAERKTPTSCKKKGKDKHKRHKPPKIRKEDVQQSVVPYPLSHEPPCCPSEVLKYLPCCPSSGMLRYPTTKSPDRSSQATEPVPQLQSLEENSQMAWFDSSVNHLTETQKSHHHRHQSNKSNASKAPNHKDH